MQFGPLVALAKVHLRTALDAQEIDEIIYHASCAKAALAHHVQSNRAVETLPCAQEFLETLVEKLIDIVERSDDHVELMREIARYAEDAGIIRFADDMRMTEPWVFAMDLLTENDRAFEWAQTTRERWPLENVHDAETLLNVFFRI